jgi:hypothetical protein
MSNIHYIILIVALWSIYLVFTFRPKLEKKYQKKVKEIEKKIEGVTEKKEAISDVNYEKAKKDKRERDLNTWKSLDPD